MIIDSKLASLIKKSDKFIWKEDGEDLYFGTGSFAIKTTKELFDGLFKKTKGAIYEKFGGFQGREFNCIELFNDGNFENRILNTHFKFDGNNMFANKNYYTFVNEKFINVFKDVENLRFYSSGELNPLYTIADERGVYMLIMPVKVHKSDLKYLKNAEDVEF